MWHIISELHRFAPHCYRAYKGWYSPKKCHFQILSSVIGAMSHKEVLNPDTTDFFYGGIQIFPKLLVGCWRQIKNSLSTCPRGYITFCEGSMRGGF